MGKLSKAQQIKNLQAQIAAAATEKEVQSKRHSLHIEEMESHVNIERVGRIAAQNGLTPYVYAIQAFNKWLVDERADLLVELAPILRDLGLLGVKVGYDPQKDLAISVISGKPRPGSREATRTAT